MVGEGLDEGRVVGGRREVKGRVAGCEAPGREDRVLEGAVDAVELFGAGGDGGPVVVHADDGCSRIWRRECEVDIGLSFGGGIFWRGYLGRWKTKVGQAGKPDMSVGIEIYGNNWEQYTLSKIHSNAKTAKDTEKKRMFKKTL